MIDSVEEYIAETLFGVKFVDLHSATLLKKMLLSVI